MTYDPAAVTPRRTFLGRLAAGVAGVSLLGLPPSLGAQSGDSLRAPDIESWPDGLTGKHRQVFDAVEPNSGMALVFAHVFLWTNNEASKVPERDLNAVVVLRHAAAALALTDAIWAKYKIGEGASIQDTATKAPAVRNPYYRSHPGDLPFADAAIEKLQGRGVIFGVCNVALTVLSAQRAQVAGVSPEEAKAEWLAAVIPGVTVLPSGVWGVNRAQEKGCSYCYAG